AFTYIKTLTHAHEELFEGVTMIVASAFLFYVAVWCHGAQQHVMGTVDKAITKGAALALAFTVFLAIVREGFEIVLFYAALLSSSISEIRSIAVGGALGGCALLVIYAVLNGTIAMMSTKLFFRVSSVLLIALAIYFAYNGAHELLEVVEHNG
ncbi:high-affinity Fe2+/Pb2+ permease, partial [Candidatus Pacearchaeota archaeon]|nr:high-affinity Fe2+/Pb2+ permease [Candidatus Pacearchaeota archaeon]